MKEKWYHYVCEAEHKFQSPERVLLCACGEEVYLSYVEVVQAGHYDRFQERECKCDTCGLTETLSVKNGTDGFACSTPTCGGRMWKAVYAPHIPTADLAMGESATPAAIDKWQKQRDQQKKIEERTIAEHGSL